MSEQKTILVVDDDPDIIDQLSIIIKKHGFNLIVANGEKEGQEALLRGGFDLAVFDLMMDTIDSGFTLSHHSKKLYPDVPVILITAVRSATGLSFDTTSQASASWLKANKILEKPVRPEQLIAEINRLLGTKPAVAH